MDKQLFLFHLKRVMEKKIDGAEIGNYFIIRIPNGVKVIKKIEDYFIPDDEKAPANMKKFVEKKIRAR